MLKPSSLLQVAVLGLVAVAASIEVLQSQGANLQPKYETAARQQNLDHKVSMGENYNASLAWLSGPPRKKFKNCIFMREKGLVGPAASSSKQRSSARQKTRAIPTPRELRKTGLVFASFTSAYGQARRDAVWRRVAPAPLSARPVPRLTPPRPARDLNKHEGGGRSRKQPVQRGSPAAGVAFPKTSVLSRFIAATWEPTTSSRS